MFGDSNFGKHGAREAWVHLLLQGAAATLSNALPEKL
jgi:hypothetical protein